MIIKLAFVAWNVFQRAQASLPPSHPSRYDTKVLLGKVGIYHDSNTILIPVRVRASFFLEEVWYDCFQ